MYSCDSKGGSVVSPPVIHDTNIYGNGNGKITFYRTSQITGNVTISISGNTLADSLVWQQTPACDTTPAVSKILPAGDYTARIEGASFLCNYNIKVEERICKLINYTGCANGYVGCYPLTERGCEPTTVPAPTARD